MLKRRCAWGLDAAADELAAVRPAAVRPRVDTLVQALRDAADSLKQDDGG